MTFPIVGYYIVSLQLVLILTCTAAMPKDEGGEPAVEGTCQNVNILMASNATDGTKVILASTKDATNSQPINTTIADHHLPPECQANHLCGILHFGHPSGTSHYFIPSIRGFVVLSYRANYKDNCTEELPWYSFIGVTENCNPTRAFLARNGRIVIVACMNLQSRPHGSLYYMHYNLLSNSTGSGWIVERHSALPMRSEIIYKPETVSEIIHVRGQMRCQERDSLYFIDDGIVLRFPTSGTSDPGFTLSDLDHPLENCIGYQSFEHYDGSDNLIIHCSNNQTALYDSCGSGRFTYAPDDRVPYPCTNWSTVAYRNGTQLTLDGEIQLQLPSGDINYYARCVQGVNHPIFIASLADGVFITRFDGNNFTEITSGNCSNNDNGACLRPVFLESDLMFVMFDSGSLAIINMTEGCTYDPVIARIPIPFQPDLTSVSLGRETYNCSCSAVQNTKPPPTDSTTGPPPTMQTDSTLDISESTTNNQTERAEQPDSTMAIHQTESTFSVTKFSPSSSHQAPISRRLLAGLITVGAVIVLVIAAIIVYLVCRHVRSSRVKEEKDFTLNVEFPLQESPDNQHFHKNLGNNAENQGDGGYGSGETPTTISLSESAETASSISGESECTVSAHTEAGQQGGEIHIPSNLPLKCTQIGAQHVLEQYQSRTSDNRDKDDMENKVHTFTAEDNNRERDNNHTASLNNNN